MSKAHNIRDGTIKKWTSCTEYVDEDTGEEISKYWFKKRNYTIIYKYKIYRYHEKNSIKTGKIVWVNVIRENYQTRMFS